MHASDGALLGRRLKGAKGLALLGAAVLMGALLVSIDDGSASDGSASAAPSKIALLRTSTDPDGVRLELYVINADGSGSWSLVAAGSSSTAAAQYELGQRPAWSPDGRRSPSWEWMTMATRTCTSWGPTASASSG